MLRPKRESPLWVRTLGRIRDCGPYGGLAGAVSAAPLGATAQAAIRRKQISKLAENVTHAACRDLLRDALMPVEAAGFPVVLQVHDDVLAEVPADQDTADRRADFADLMAVVPDWAAGLPVAVSTWAGERYWKG